MVIHFIPQGDKINNRNILTGIVEYSGVDVGRGIDVCIAIDKFEKMINY